MENGKTYDMPDFFSHCILAEKIFEKLNEKHKRKITSISLYNLGAQGGDVFFAYNLSLKKRVNVGKLLHALDPEKLFRRLCLGNPSYVAGFATHYAVDSVLHPFVYDFERLTKKALSHMSFENDLGVYLSDKFAIKRRILCPQTLSACIFPVYDTLKNALPFITVTGVERCLKRYYLYMKYNYKFKREKIKEQFDFSHLDGAIEKCIERGVSAVENVLDGEIERGDIFDGNFLSGSEL